MSRNHDDNDRAIQSSFHLSDFIGDDVTRMTVEFPTNSFTDGHDYACPGFREFPCIYDDFTLGVVRKNKNNNNLTSVMFTSEQKQRKSWVALSVIFTLLYIIMMASIVFPSKIRQPRGVTASTQTDMDISEHDMDNNNISVAIPMLHFDIKDNNNNNNNNQNPPGYDEVMLLKL
jgi:hypothetical protein